MNAEQQIIGSLFMDKDAIGMIANELEPKMFENKVCGAIYYEFQKAYATGQNVDYFTITEKYKDKPQVESEIKYCIDGIITSVNISDSAALVKKKYRANLLGNLISTVKPSADNIDELLKALQVKIDELTTNAEVGAHTLGELTSMYRDNYFREHELINFGFKKLDGYLGKLDRGDTTVIGARPSVGKSALSAQLGLKLSDQGYKVGFFVLEMGPEQIYERFVSMKSGIEMQRIRQATDFLNDEKEKFDKGNDELEKSQLEIITNCNSVEDIRRITKVFGFDLIIVDYLQLVKAKSTYAGNRVNEVSEVSADFKRLAKEMNCHVILLSQLNRRTEEKARPTMADIRESGAIEQDASNIILMWNLKTENEKGLSIEKCRQGKKGGIVYQFDGDTMTFKETDKDLKEEEKWETVKKNPFSFGKEQK